jgi:hypothetical protein
MTIQIDNVDTSISAVGSETNIAIDLQPKGTGALNVAAGSSGVNISNGGTVTLVSRTATGSGYTGLPTVTIGPPTIAGGVQATATVSSIGNTQATIASGGTGYTVGDILSTNAGVIQTGAATFTVSTVSGGVITAITSTGNGGGFTSVPTNPVATTGGTGTGATLNILSNGWYIVSVGVTNAGSGYVEQPTVTFSGGGGSGAAAYATVGSDTTLRSLGTNLFLNTPSGTVLRLINNTLGANTGNVQISNAQGNGGVTITTSGSNANTPLFLGAGGTGAVNFFTGSTGNIQVRVAHTASAVNSVQITGAATTGVPSIVASGSDANVALSIRGQGTGYLNLMNNQANYFQVYSAAAGSSPTMYVWGSDTNVNYNIASKGSGSVVLRTNDGSSTQAIIAHTASAVNYVQITGAATGAAPVMSAQGSDTNIPLVIQPKGTGALQAQRTDSTATGGNARGANAVDWQTNRSAAGQVAVSSFATIGGGSSNTVGSSGVAATVAGGFNNNSNNAYTFVGGGVNNSATAINSVVVGGNANTAGGISNFIGGGFTNSGTSGSAVTTQATSAVTSGSTAVTLSGSNANIRVGQFIFGTGIAGQTYVSAISGTSLTLSQNATATGTPTLSFFTPHGVVVGGGNNQATGSYSFIGGGGDAGTAANRNVASGDWSTVVGGRTNTASNIGATVGGGGNNQATGNYSFVGGGGDAITASNRNLASGTWSTIAGGNNNTASGNGAFVGGGGVNNSNPAAGNTASAESAVVGGGIGNIASAKGTTLGGGYFNVSNSQFSTVAGGVRGTTRSIEGIHVFPACVIPIADTAGLTQASLLVLARQTTNATPTVLASNNSTPGTSNQVILPNNSAYIFKITVISGVTGGGNTSAWKLEGAIKRGANAASTALVGSVTTTLLAQDAGASTWAIAATADTTNGGLAITFTGQAGTTIRTVAKVETTEMTF